ncbi:waterproof, partial [Carabus blaptoides fortunei]
FVSSRSSNNRRQCPCNLSRGGQCTIRRFTEVCDHYERTGNQGSLSTVPRHQEPAGTHSRLDRVRQL